MHKVFPTLLFLLLISSTAIGQSSLNFTKITGTSGSTNALVAVDDKLYAGAGTRFLILDLSIPPSPKIQGAIFLQDFITSIELNDKIAYVALGKSGIQSIDISDPSEPVLLDQISTSGFVSELVANGTQLYVATQLNGIQIIDTTDPQQLKITKSIAIPGETIAVDFQQNRLFAVENETKLHIIDLTVPDNPQTISELTVSNIKNLHVDQNNIAYIVGDGLKIFELSDPQNPKFLGAILTSTKITELTIENYTHETIAYLIAPDLGVKAISVTNPQNLSETGFFDAPGRAFALSSSGEKIIMSDGDAKFHILLHRPDHSIYKTGQWHTLGEARDLAVINSDTIYIANGSAGLEILKLDQTSDKPIFVESQNQIVIDDKIERIQINGNHAYLSGDDLTILDISDPDNPVFYAKNRTPNHSRGVAFHGGYVYIADDSSGIQIAEIDGEIIATLDTPGTAQDILIENGIGYIADGKNGIRIIDLADATSPIERGNLPASDFESSANRLKLIGQILFVAEGFGGLRILSVANPNFPVELGRFDTSSFVQELLVDKNIVYLADSNDGVRQLDISDLSNPIELGFFDTNGTASGIAFAGKNIVVADDFNGVVLATPEQIDYSPFITAVEPSHGTFDGTLEISISGENFSDDLTLRIGGIEQENVNFISSEQLTLTPTIERLGATDLTVMSRSTGKGGRFPKALTNEVANPKLSSSTAKLDFGTVLLGAENPTTLSFDLTNIGGRRLLLSSIELPSLAFDISPEPQLWFEVNETKTFNITFEPKTLSVLSDWLKIESNDPNSPLEIPIEATVHGAAETLTVSGFGTHETLRPAETSELLEAYEIRVTNQSSGVFLFTNTQNLPDTPNYSIRFDPVDAEPVASINDEILVEILRNGELRGEITQSVTADDLLRRGVQIDFVIPFPPPELNAIVRIDPENPNLTLNLSNGGGETPVRIRGAGFREGSVIAIGDKVLETIEILSSTELNAITPLNVSGTYDLTIENVDGQEATLTNAYSYNPIDHAQFKESPIVIKLGELIKLEIEPVEQNGFPLEIAGNITWGFRGHELGSLTVDGKFSADKIGSTVMTGSYSPEASFGKSFSAETTLIVVAGSPHVLTLSANPEVVTIDGKSTSLIEVDIRDVQNNPIDGETVEFESSAGTFSPTQNVGGGIYRATFTSSADANAGTTPIIATTSNGKKGAVSISLGLPAGSLTLEAETDRLVADGLQKTTLTATVIDVEGNPAPDKILNISTSAGKIGDLRDNGDGTYSIEYLATTTIAGNVQIVATTEHDVKSFTNIRLNGGDPTKIELRMANSQTPADGRSKIALKILLTDIFNNPVTGRSITFELEPTVGSGRIENLLDNGDGSYSATYIAGTSIGNVKIIAKSEQVTDEVPVLLTLYDYVNFSLTSEPTAPVADGETQANLVLSIIDLGGNPIENLTVSMSSAIGRVLTNVEEKGDGIYTATYLPPTSTAPVTIIAIASDGHHTVFSPLTLNLSPDLPDSSTSEISIETDENNEAITVPADGVEDVKATVVLKDRFGNLVPGIDVHLISETITTTPEASQKTDGNGEATFRLRSKVEGSNQLSAKSSDRTNFEVQSTVNFSSPTITELTFLEVPESIKGDGETTAELLFRAQNDRGEPISSATISLSANIGKISSPARLLHDGHYNATFTAPDRVGTATITAEPTSSIHVGSQRVRRSVTVKILAGKVSPTSSKVETFPNSALANGDEPIFVNMFINDKYGSPIPDRTLLLEVVGDDVSITQPVGVTDLNGKITGEIRSTKSGQKTIIVKDNTIPETPITLLESPIVTFIPPTPASIELASESPSVPADGKTTTEITIIVRDRFGSPIDGGDITLSVSGVADAEGTIGEIESDEAGTYMTDFTAPKLPKTIELTATTSDGLTGSLPIEVEKIDEIPPTFTAATVDSTSIKVSFSETVSGGDLENWHVNEEPIKFITKLTDENAILLTLAEPITPDARPSVRYIETAQSLIADLSGNPIEAESIAIAEDDILPLYSARVSSPNSVEVSFSETMIGTSKSGWLMTLDGKELTIVKFFEIKKNLEDPLVGLLPSASVWGLEVSDGDSEVFGEGDAAILQYLPNFRTLVDKGGNMPSDVEVVAHANNSPTLLLTDASGNVLRGDSSITISEGSVSTISLFAQGDAGETLSISTDPVELDFTELSSGEKPELVEQKYQLFFPFDTATAIDATTEKSVTFRVSDGIFSATQTILFSVQNLSQAANIAIESNFDRLVANGEAQTGIVATVTSPEGLAVVDEIITLKVSDSRSIGTSNNLDGTYFGVYLVNEKLGKFTVTAEASNGKSASIEIEHLPEKPKTLSLTTNLIELLASPKSTATLTLTVRDIKNRPVDGANVIFSPPPIGSISAPTAIGNGKYRVTFTADQLDLEQRKVLVEATVNELRTTTELLLRQPNKPPILQLFDFDEKELIGELLQISIVEGEQIQLTLRAKDPENSEVKLSVEGLPETAQFSSTEGGFSWEIGTDVVVGNEGTKVFPIRFIATDSVGGSTIRTVELEVLHSSPANGILIFTDPDSLVAGEVETVETTILLTDIDGVRLADESVILTVDRGGDELETLTAIDKGNGIYGVALEVGETAEMLRLVAKVSNTDLTSETTVRIYPAEPIEIIIDRPVNPQNLRAGETFIFSAVGKDQYQNQFDISDRAVWSADGNIGEIDSSGIFTVKTVGTGTIFAKFNGLEAESPEITVVAGELTKIEIEPPISELRIGESQNFSVNGFDGWGNAVDILPSRVQWEVVGSIGKFSRSEFDPAKLGVGQIRAIVGEVIGISPTITVIPGITAEIRVVPHNASDDDKSELNLKAGDRKKFRAIAYDMLGNEVEIADAEGIWTVVGEPIGNINDGWLTAKNTGNAQIQLAIGEVFGRSARIFVKPNDIKKIELSPMYRTLLAGDEQIFTVTVRDNWDNPIDVEEVQWQVIGDIGAIDEAGKFQARTAGVGQLRLTVGSLAQHSGQINVKPTELAAIEIYPAVDRAIAIGDQLDFNLIGVDTFDNQITIENPKWEIVGDSIGDVSSDGQFTATKKGFGRVKISSGDFSVESDLIVVADLVDLSTPEEVGGGAGQEITLPIEIANLDPSFDEVPAKLLIGFPADLLEFITIEPESDLDDAEISDNILTLSITTAPSPDLEPVIIGVKFMVLESAEIDASGQIGIRSADLLGNHDKPLPIEISETTEFFVLPNIGISLDSVSAEPGETVPIDLKLEISDFGFENGTIGIAPEVEDLVFMGISFNKDFASIVTLNSDEEELIEFTIDEAIETSATVGTIEVLVEDFAIPNEILKLELSVELLTEEEFPIGIVRSDGEISVLDVEAPFVDKFKINSDKVFTANREVTLTIVSEDLDSEITSMRFQNEQDFDENSTVEWLEFSDSPLWNLSENDGLKTVFMQLRDSAGNVTTESLSDGIVLDQTAPIGTVSTEKLAVRVAAIELKLSADDELSNMSEVGEMRIRNGVDGEFGDESWQAFAENVSWAIDSEAGTKNIFVQFRDGAGNISELLKLSVELDFMAPELQSKFPEGSHVSIDSEIVLQFDEEISSIGENGLKVEGDIHGELDGTMTIENSSVRFVPDRFIGELENVTVTLDLGVKDLLENAMTEKISWTFSTGLAVFPGDANSDSEVNILDLVPIGRYWGQSGSAREGASNEWRLQAAIPFAADRRATYADCDGDGIVTAEDVIPIALNWHRETGRKFTMSPSKVQNIKVDREIYREIYEVLEGLPVEFEGVKFLLDFVSAQMAASIDETILLQNYPNPFNPETWIPFELSESSVVTIEIFSVNGELVRLLELGKIAMGNYVDRDSGAIHWDGRNNSGEKVSSGIYFYRMTADNFRSTRKMILLK